MRKLHPINWPVSGDIPETIECPTCGTICSYTTKERIEEKRENNMNFNEYQRECKKTDVGTSAQDCIKPGWLYYVLGIAGESGELMEKIKKLFRDKNGIVDFEFKEAIIKEMGDIQWYMARLADWFEIDFESVFITNIEKLQSRKARNKIHGEGDNR